MNRKQFMQTAWAVLASPLVMKGARAQALAPGEASALNEAIQDEYKARATYRKVVEKFGPVRPFTNIINAETQHVAALTRLFEQYGLTVPSDSWIAKVPTFATLEEACIGAVNAEVENAKLYEKLLAATDKPDIIRVFEALQRASQEKHLPAFQRCADQGVNAAPGERGRQGNGQGRMQGQGGGPRSGQGRMQGRNSGLGSGQGRMQGQGGGRGSGQGPMTGQSGGSRGQGRMQGQGRAQGRGGNSGNGRGPGSRPGAR